VDFFVRKKKQNEKTIKAIKRGLLSRFSQTNCLAVLATLVVRLYLTLSNGFVLFCFLFFFFFYNTSLNYTYLRRSRIRGGGKSFVRLSQGRPSSSSLVKNIRFIISVFFFFLSRDFSFLRSVRVKITLLRTLLHVSPVRV